MAGLLRQGEGTDERPRHEGRAGAELWGQSLDADAEDDREQRLLQNVEVLQRLNGMAPHGLRIHQVAQRVLGRRGGCIGLEDECISHEKIQQIHRCFAGEGAEAAIEGLAERESSLAAFVMCGGVYLSHTAKRAGAPNSFVRWINEEVITRMLVAVEAQRQAHQELWGDLLKEACEPAQHGGDMADEQKPRVSALAMAKRSDDCHDPGSGLGAAAAVDRAVREGVAR